MLAHHNACSRAYVCDHTRHMCIYLQMRSLASTLRARARFYAAVCAKFEISMILSFNGCRVATGSRRHQPPRKYLTTGSLQRRPANEVGRVLIEGARPDIQILQRYCFAIASILRSSAYSRIVRQTENVGLEPLLCCVLIDDFATGLCIL